MRPKRQEGSALIVGLVLLLVVTILAITGMQDTLLQERMSGNWHDRNLAFQASEAALREGEHWINQRTLSELDAIDQSSAHEPLTQPAAWEGAGQHGSINLDGIADEASFYVVHPSYSRMRPDMDLAQPKCDRYFPVYAHGVGGTVNARATLQSSVMPTTAPPADCPADWGG
ncbi:hypothetical protein TVD_01430 [Thioalkalivibrio versutus]|uniref:Type 4 fimbrial biogenesis protein PilX N-terminal domain-containing protein n=1 Tax=Thioalkalivibrio versutus TaxID=106634 RepID=A0A0G3GA10_9GAMM|nr:hypothetical protein TVD_01430 [Thioalkalivibrio versutus]